MSRNRPWGRRHCGGRAFRPSSSSSSSAAAAEAVAASAVRWTAHAAVVERGGPVVVHTNVACTAVVRTGPLRRETSRPSDGAAGGLARARALSLWYLSRVKRRDKTWYKKNSISTRSRLRTSVKRRRRRLCDVDDCRRCSWLARGPTADGLAETRGAYRWWRGGGGGGKPHCRRRSLWE